MSARRHLPMLPKRPSTIVVYRGPSMLDGKPIVCIASGLDGSSDNGKTGPMVQVWIMAENIAPHLAQKTGDDASVCGHCPKRPSLPREKGVLPCYVETFMGPRSTWEANRDKPAVTLGEVREAIATSGIPVRLGAYGDPAALPADVLSALVVDAHSHVGYTHQWADRRFQWLRHLVMASVDTKEERDRACALGWRTFRAIPRNDVFADLRSSVARLGNAREIFCPTVLAHAKVQCAQCRLCNGRTWEGHEDKRASIAIFEH